MSDVNANIGSTGYKEKTILLGIQPSVVRVYPCAAATVLPAGCPVATDAAGKIVEWNPAAADNAPAKIFKGILMKAVTDTDELAQVITMGFVKGKNIAFKDKSALNLSQKLQVELQHVYLQG